MKTKECAFCLLLLVFLDALPDASSLLRFPNSYSNHMVLQQAPQRAVLWGYADVIGDAITVLKNGVNAGSTLVQKSLHNASVGVWKLKLQPESNTAAAYQIKITSSEGSISLSDVRFGDVWLCSGQSNMQFTMREVNDSGREINESIQHVDIRMIHSTLIQSNVPKDDVLIYHPWIYPTKGIIEGFSSLCYLYAMEIQKSLQYPIGLIESDWGGTPIEYWSSPDAIATCHTGPSSVLWNSMIHPYLPMTIKGAIWYQGEANSGNSNLYACQFPAMISDWRKKFHAASDGETRDDFPFGFVQLAPWRPENLTDGFPPTRWAQTAKFGYVPNSLMPNTFMAVAIDLPDFNSPSGSIHPRYKHELAYRLALGARRLVYGETNVEYQAPFPTSYHLNAASHRLEITFDNGTANVHLLNNKGFEICCAHVETSHCDAGVTWIDAPILNTHGAVVEINTSSCSGNNHVAGVRYLWRESPCLLKQCALYSNVQNLPVPPFIQTGGFNQFAEIIG